MIADSKAVRIHKSTRDKSRADSVRKSWADPATRQRRLSGMSKAAGIKPRRAPQPWGWVEEEFDE